MDTTASAATAGAPILTKSDYTLARSCASKLYYRKHGYPSNAADDPQVEALARGGYQVEALARAQRPGGIELTETGDHEADHAATMALLVQPRVTLFNATLLVGDRLARIDILEKDGQSFRLIEVKARSFKYRDHLNELAKGGHGHFRGTRAPYRVKSAWKEKLEDVTFQSLVLEALFPGYTIVPFLLLVDRERETAHNYEPLRFDYQYSVRPTGSRRVQSVRYAGDAAAAASADIFAQVDLSSEVAELRAEVEQAASQFSQLIEMWASDGPHPASPLGAMCRNCEFRVDAAEQRNGFAQCWGALAEPKPHLLELYKVSRALGPSGGRLVDEMIEDGKTALVDVREDLLEDGDTEGTDDFRRAVQIRHTRAGTAWFGRGLRTRMDSAVYPLHFIDFETSSVALPYHAGMRPYGTVAFQLSCHTVASPGAEPTHREWLNDGRIWCNGRFAQALRDTIGDHGTVLTWASHEASVIRHIANDLEKFEPEAVELINWLRDLDEGPRIFDLNELTLQSYFHPDMGGRTSVKVVLKALSKHDAELRAQLARWMDLTVAPDQSPYDALPSLEVDGLALTVADGTGAMAAYEQMMYGAGKTDKAIRAAWRELLLRYCKLDTLAMVLIWEHWRREALGA